VKTKEISVGVTYPYQLGPYMYGRVDLSELIVIEEGDNIESIKTGLINKLKKQAEEGALLIVHGEKASDNVISGAESPTSTRRRRRFEEGE